jgi:GNAT superfamily N-acetyltransferase
MPVAETMCFEDVYENSLRLDRDEKTEIISNGVATWMLVDGMLAGEIYGVTPAHLDEDTPDVPKNDPRSIYCYSTTLLPQFQGRGLSKILVAYWNGLARGAGFEKVIGHATSPGIVAVRAFFGARFGATHCNWYGTTRTARYYECEL